MKDIFSKILEKRWRWLLLIFLLAHISTWLGFSLLWFLVILINGDLGHLDDRSWEPCIVSVNSFYSFLLWSVESQHTIGYGYRILSDRCPQGFLVLFLESTFDVLIHCITVSIFFAKLMRPQRRDLSIEFSEKCVICLRDGKLCLLLRMANLKKSNLIDVKVNAFLVKTRYTYEGEEIPFHHDPLILRIDQKPSAFPLTACHEIVPSSPLYDLSSQHLRDTVSEILVTLTATDSSSGCSCETSTSYLPDKILWGYRFTKMISMKEDKIIFDMTYLNDIHRDGTPECSAIEMEDRGKFHRSIGRLSRQNLTPSTEAASLRRRSIDTVYFDRRGVLCFYGSISYRKIFHLEDDWSTSRADFVRLLPPHPPKIVDQNGVVQIHRKGAWGKWRKIRYFFSIMLELRWRWHLLIFLLAYLGSWLGFAMLWFIVLHFHGDLGHLDDPSWNHCIINVNSFYSVLLFSVETQHTIGYSYRYPSDKCPEGFIIIFLQSILGVLIQCITVSVLYAKMTRPQGRAHSIEFSKRCKSKLIGVQVNAHLLKTRYTEEGEEIPFYQRLLILKTDEKPRVYPLTACHEIGPSSPLYDLSRQHLRDMYFEVLVMLTATDSASGHSFEALASYLTENILWGYRFCKMISIDKDKIYADMKYFNEVYRVATPKCSAMELEDRQRK
ncbi:KCNJ6, partial [Cordylochernes scorpioides]